MTHLFIFVASLTKSKVGALSEESWKPEGVGWGDGVKKNFNDTD